PMTFQFSRRSKKPLRFPGLEPSGLSVLVHACALAAPYPAPQEAHHQYSNRCDAKFHAEPDGIQWVHRPPTFPMGNDGMQAGSRDAQPVEQHNHEWLFWKKRWYFVLLVNAFPTATHTGSRTPRRDG